MALIVPASGPITAYTRARGACTQERVIRTCTACCPAVIAAGNDQHIQLCKADRRRLISTCLVQPLSMYTAHNLHPLNQSPWSAKWQSVHSLLSYRSAHAKGGGLELLEVCLCKGLELLLLCCCVSGWRAECQLHHLSMTQALILRLRVQTKKRRRRVGHICWDIPKQLSVCPAGTSALC